jgi:uncharacterized protein (TIGR02646 family)
MMKIIKTSAPDRLSKNWKKWSHKFAQNRAKNATFAFQWATHKGIRINELILPHLRNIQKDHCCYCDGYPVAAYSVESIEHFRPKSKYPLLAYYWGNLFYACSRCQNIKLEHYEKLLLKPDTIEYDFNTYFLFNSTSGEIEVNTFTTTLAQQQKAAFTLKLLDLNCKVLCKNRLREARGYRMEDNIADMSYRFIFF